MELYKKKKVNGKNRVFKGNEVMSWKEIVEELNKECKCQTPTS